MSALRVHHLNCAVIQRLSLRGRHLVCHVLLVETPASGLVLVDTGLGTADYRDIASRLGEEFAYGYARPKIDPALAAVAQIEAAGFARTDVRHIVMTHLDLDHVGGLSDFPAAKVHVHAREHAAAMKRDGFRARRRYRPAMWAHGPDFRLYSEEGEPWFGFEAVRGLEGLPPEMLLVPLFGHTLGHSGVAIESDRGWLLQAGDAFFDPREVHGPKRSCAPGVALFQTIVTTDRRLRFYNQDRLRALTAERPELRVFASHDPSGLPADYGIGASALHARAP
ncbi:MAG TPA: MBL fold metallo-hydrolase [Polyangiaceae bacterium]|nr:MBL fold metallo-hydrolase [Polyangiaceae bacterium]